MIRLPEIGHPPLCLTLLLLAACSTAPPREPEPPPVVVETQLVSLTPPPLVPCEVQEGKLRRNGDLLGDRNRYARALDECNSQVKTRIE